MLQKGLVCMWLVLAAASCAREKEAPEDYQTGKNRFTTMVDGDSREYYVHVPGRYDGGQPVPLVFMLHGTSGDGDKFYAISGWKELGEAENILTVFPSSWHYCIIDNGEVKNTTKWNIYPGSFDYCAGEVPRDDVKFLGQIVNEMRARFNVDSKRIYLAGFSGGGSMAFRAAVEMSDVFAAVVQASGSVTTATTFVPKRNLPLLFQIGNSDDLILGPGTTIPMTEFEDYLNHNPSFQNIIFSHRTTFSFESQYTLSGSAASVLVATFAGIPNAGNRHFQFWLVKDLDHEYPNGSNHWLKGAEVHWNWFKGYMLP